MKTSTYHVNFLLNFLFAVKGYNDALATTSIPKQAGKVSFLKLAWTQVWGATTTINHVSFQREKSVIIFSACFVRWEVSENSRLVVCCFQPSFERTNEPEQMSFSSTPSFLVKEWIPELLCLLQQDTNVNTIWKTTRLNSNCKHWRTRTEHVKVRPSNRCWNEACQKVLHNWLQD